MRRELLDLLVAAERFSEAIPLQEEEAAQFPENQEALHRLALLHYWQRDYQAAAQVYQRLLEKAAEDAALRREAAQAAEAAQQVDQALSHYLWLYARHQGQKGIRPGPGPPLVPERKSRRGRGGAGSPHGGQPEPETQRWYGLELLLIGGLRQVPQGL